MGHARKDSLFVRTSLVRTLAGYGLMLLGAVALFAVVRSYGEGLVAPAPLPGAPPAGTTPAHPHTFAQVLLALAVIVVAARAVGALFERVLRQPPVMGEIVAGLALGPSVLGAISSDAYAFLLPPAIAPHLGIVAKIGVVLFMFLVGLELDPRPLQRNTHATLAISHASIVAPFALGTTLALALYPVYSSSAVSFTVFALFLGVSMSVTAFPVLARILTDRRLQSTPLGVTALACAAVDDATAWCLLAVVSGVATAQMGDAGWTIGLVAAYLVAMFVVVRPIARWLSAREEQRAAERPVSTTVLALVFAMLLVSAWATEAIGIHALFGAFVLGALIPHDGRLADQLRARMEDLVLVLLVPLFFAFTGMRTQIGLVSSAQDWLFLAVIVGVATLG